jgi:hypothetical protein
MSRCALGSYLLACQAGTAGLAATIGAVAAAYGLLATHGGCLLPPTGTNSPATAAELEAVRGATWSTSIACPISLASGLRESTSPSSRPPRQSAQALGMSNHQLPQQIQHFQNRTPLGRLPWPRSRNWPLTAIVLPGSGVLTSNACAPKAAP